MLNKLFQNIWAHLPWSNARGKCYGIIILQPLRHSREWTSSVLFVFETFRNGAAPEPVPKVSRRTTCKKVPTILRTFRRAKTLTHCRRTTYILYILIANCSPTNLRYMYEHIYIYIYLCTYLETKWPLFWSEKALFWKGWPSKNRGHWGSRYIL